jgi:hypothetical protein
MNGEETLIGPVVHKAHYEAPELDGVDIDDQESFSDFQLDVIAQAIVECAANLGARSDGGISNPRGWGEG